MQIIVTLQPLQGPQWALANACNSQMIFIAAYGKCCAVERVWKSLGMIHAIRPSLIRQNPSAQHVDSFRVAHKELSRTGLREGDRPTGLTCEFLYNVKQGGHAQLGLSVRQAVSVTSTVALVY